jgi:hypothetical protein
MLFRLAAAFALAAILGACGGSGNSSPAPPPPSGGGTTATNPCAAALTTENAEPGPSSLLALGARPIADKSVLVDGDPRGRLEEALALHRAGARSRPSVSAPAPVEQDAGQIAVLQDQGDLILPADPFDLANAGLRFTPAPTGYAVEDRPASFRSSLGQQLTLGDDDSVEVDVPFGFRFFGATETKAFVNSDGNVTFVEEDKASTDRDIARVLTGPPRIAPFLSDLDPSSGGRIFVHAANDGYTVTWCGVRGFDSTRTVTAQVTLLPDGTIDMAYAQDITLGDAVVAIGPGRGSRFDAVDLSAASAPTSGNDAIGERFAASASIDTVAIADRFYASHPDSFDQLLIWTDQPLVHDAFAYEVTVANEIRGIGQSIYDDSRQFGSPGALRSIVVMDWLGKYPADPTTRFLRENNTLSVMGQEVGHRWLAYMHVRDHTGASSDVLLGRDLAHWSFFFNSEASVMEGNEITDLGGGDFKTTDAVRRYSHLDQYAMGLIRSQDVPTMFYVEAPVSSHAREDAPQIGVTFSGTRRDFLISDIIAVNGDRVPTSAASPRVHRQAFIYLVSAGRSADASQVAKLDGIRRAWEPFFHQATSGRMTAVTALH